MTVVVVKNGARVVMKNGVRERFPGLVYGVSAWPLVRHFGNKIRTNCVPHRFPHRFPYRFPHHFPHPFPHPLPFSFSHRFPRHLPLLILWPGPIFTTPGGRPGFSQPQGGRPRFSQAQSSPTVAWRRLGTDCACPCRTKPIQ